MDRGPFGSSGQAPPGNFEQLNFDQIEHEEQLLEEQYRLLSQNQRAPYRLAVSREPASAVTSQRQRTAPNFLQPSTEPSQHSNMPGSTHVESNRRGRSRQSRSNSSERVGSQRQREYFGQVPVGGTIDHYKARSLVVSSKHHARNTKNQAHNTGPVSNQ